MRRDSAPRFSPHLEATLTYLERIGYVPGDPSPLRPGQPVPGCSCADCLGLPTDHPARTAGPRLPTLQRVIHPRELDAARAVPIARVAADLGLELRRAGASSRGPCPLHRGDGPNFAIYARTNRFRCYVCDATGDTIELVRQVRELGFREAVAWLLGRDPEEVDHAA